MNHEQRRQMRVNALRSMKTSKAYVLVTFDGVGMPLFHYDLTQCDNPGDIRHAVMHKISVDMDESLAIAGNIVTEKFESIKAQDYKQKRSEELSDFRSDEGQESKAIPSSTGEDIAGRDLQECGIHEGTRACGSVLVDSALSIA